MASNETAKKRQADTPMEVEVVNGIEGKVKQHSAKKKAKIVQNEEFRKGLLQWRIKVTQRMFNDTTYFKPEPTSWQYLLSISGSHHEQHFTAMMLVLVLRVHCAIKHLLSHLDSPLKKTLISVPAHRYSPLKENWMKIFTPIVEYLKLQVRFNLRSRNVEIRTSPETTDIANLQKAADFVRAFVCGFEVEDALALLRLDDLFIETFEIKDVRQQLKGDHQSRAVGRLAGKGGRTKFTIENVTKTRIVLADTRIHILGSHQNIQLARRAICNLILGSPPSKVYGHLRNIANSKISQQF